MFRLRPINDEDVLKAIAEPPFRGFPQDEVELAALFNRILETIVLEGVTEGLRRGRGG
jgi:hypothetical protein